MHTHTKLSNLATLDAEEIEEIAGIDEIENFELHSKESWDSSLSMIVTRDNKAQLFPYLRGLSKMSLSAIKLLPSPLLAQLPPIMQTELSFLFEENSTLQPELEQFIESFIQVNANAKSFQQRNIKLFFMQNHESIMQIIDVMGIEGIHYLRNHLAGTVLHLERTLAVIPILPKNLQEKLLEYFIQSNISTQKNPKAIHAIKTCIIILDLLIHMPNYANEDYFILSQDQSPEEYVLILAKILLDQVFHGIQTTLSSDEISAIFERITAEKLVSLIAASKHMSKDQYRDVYLSLLKLDLTQGNINDFFHNTAQENQTGRALAFHNKRIQNKLQQAGISPETALHYEL